MAGSILQQLSRSMVGRTEMGGSELPTVLSIAMAILVGGVLLMCVRQLLSLFYDSGASRPDGSSLPKGSLGWPIIGETHAYTRNPQEFARSHVQRYGRVFKSYLFQRRAILGTTPEFAKFVATNAKLVHLVPGTLADVLGPKSMLVQDGPPHMALRKLVIKFIGTDALRGQVQHFESIILQHLASWERSGTVDAKTATQKISWDISNWVLFKEKNPTSSPQGQKQYADFKKIMGCLGALPVRLPGTAYHTGTKARAEFGKHFKNLAQRAKGQSSSEGSFVEALLAARDDPEAREELKDLDDDAVSDNIFLLNFAAYDTTSATLLWIIKLLVDHPDVFRRVQAEQQEILDSKGPSAQGPRLTWEDMRNMDYTQKFFREVHRYVSLVPFMFAEATEDITFEGHLVPKGWVVMVLTDFIHSDPANYPDLSFNPDRFDVNPKPYTYIPFTVGPHMCPGIELAKLVACILIHYITTAHMFERAGPDKGVESDGVLRKPRGYPIKYAGNSRLAK